MRSDALNLIAMIIEELTAPTQQHRALSVVRKSGQLMIRGRLNDVGRRQHEFECRRLHHSRAHDPSRVRP